MKQTEKKIEEGNKIIAVFDGMQIGALHGWMSGNVGEKAYRKIDGEITEAYSFSKLKYHTSWDWLMPVVEKISQHRYEDYGKCEPYQDCAYPRTFGMLTEEGKPMVRINASSLFIADTLIEAAWLAVVDFIKYYNEKKIDNSPKKFTVK